MGGGGVQGETKKGREKSKNKFYLKNIYFNEEIKRYVYAARQ